MCLQPKREIFRHKSGHSHLRTKCCGFSSIPGIKSKLLEITLLVLDERLKQFLLTPSSQRSWQNKSIISNIYIHNVFNFDDPEFLWLCIWTFLTECYSHIINSASASFAFLTLLWRQLAMFSCQSYRHEHEHAVLHVCYNSAILRVTLKWTVACAWFCCVCVCVHTRKRTHVRLYARNVCVFKCPHSEKSHDLPSALLLWAVFQHTLRRVV